MCRKQIKTERSIAAPELCWGCVNREKRRQRRGTWQKINSALRRQGYRMNWR